MNILHTSDWHIGKRLNNETRYDEFAEFLLWICHAIDAYEIDILIVSGDIFDSMTPSNKSQELYYQFLYQVNKTTIKHLIIIAGNHDSPTFLDAPKNLLKTMNIHIIGSMPTDVTEEVIILYDDHVPCAIIACVPYLRDKDIRTTQFGETLTEREHNTTIGIHAHYHMVGDYAKSQQNDIKHRYNKTVPIIATGHLFVIGAKESSDDDGMRNIGGIYIGTLGAIDSQLFSQFDYVALGHIHAMQAIQKNHIYYSGSPIAMGFGEADKPKYVLLVQSNHLQSGIIPSITPIVVPNFRILKRITGDIDDIKQSICSIQPHHPNLSYHLPCDHVIDPSFLIKPKPIWLDIEYTGKTAITDLKSQIETYLMDYPHLIALNIKDKSLNHIQHQTLHGDFMVSELDPYHVFVEFIADKLEDKDKSELINAYQTLLIEIAEEDKQAI